MGPSSNIGHVWKIAKATPKIGDVLSTANWVYHRYTAGVLLPCRSAQANAPPFILALFLLSNVGIQRLTERGGWLMGIWINPLSRALRIHRLTMVDCDNGLILGDETSFMIDKILHRGYSAGDRNSSTRGWLMIRMGYTCYTLIN